MSEQESGELSFSEEVRIATSETEIHSLRRRFVLAISALVALVLAAQSTLSAYFGSGWVLAGLPLLLLAVGVACAWVLSERILGPVKELNEGAQRLAEGDLEHRMALRTGDEFEVLGATFDHMAARLAATVAELEDSNLRLERLNRELRELDRVKSDLLANVSHELRTPLTAISGYVEALTGGLLGELDPVQQRSLEVVERNALRLREMIDQLLSYARVDSGLTEIELAPFDLGMVALSVVESVRAARGREIELVVATEEPPEVYGDAARIAQVIENLLTNAIKFSPPGAPVELGLREVEEGIEVAVRDRGIGIPEPLQLKIFERFYQVDASARRQYGGLGLGLAIVREILELNHSEIEVESRPGGGTTFRFVLPLAVERTGLQPVQGSRRLAIVDADAAFVQRAAAHLSGCGFTVETAAGCEQGFALVRRVRPQVILLDRVLGDGDGFDLLERLRRGVETANIPVVIVSERSERALGLRLGAAAYLRKPIAPEEIERVVLDLLEASSEDARTAAGVER